MTKFKIEIDSEKCLGYKECGRCILACEESIIISDEKTGKVKVDKTREINCDGLGACLDVCPVDALKITPESTLGCAGHGKTCSGSVAKSFNRSEQRSEMLQNKETESELLNWPVQLHLVNPNSSYFKNADLIIAADCVPFAYPDFHSNLLKGKVLAIACPKLDDTKDYQLKIRQIVEKNDIKNVKVAIMTVPCCSGLYSLVTRALSGLNVNITKKVISLDGKLVE
ncbi:ATP-binding protein [Methanococcus sp. CF]